MVSGSISTSCQECFSPFPHGTGPLSVSKEYLALPDGPGGFTLDYSCPALLRIPLRFGTLHVRSFHALWRRFPAPSIHGPRATVRSYNPEGAVTPTVWAPPRSLATTGGITLVFFSCGYLDVSVTRVGLPTMRDAVPSGRRVVPFGDPRIKGCMHLPADYRSLPRPSSPLGA